VQKVEEETARTIADIRRKKDPAERLENYQSLLAGLREIYNYGKPVITGQKGDGAGVGTMLAGAGSFVAACAIFPPTAVVAPIAFLAGGTLAGTAAGAGLGGLMTGSRKRKILRQKFGSIGNARRMYKLQEKVAVLVEKEQKVVEMMAHNKALQEKFNRTFAAKGPETEALPPAPEAAGEEARPAATEETAAPAPEEKPAPAEKENPAAEDKPAAEETKAGEGAGAKPLNNAAGAKPLDNASGAKPLEEPRPRPDYDRFKNFGR
jgi:hypothetical protein